MQILLCLLLIAGLAFSGCTTQDIPEVILPPSGDTVTVSASIYGPENICAGTLVEVRGSVRGDPSNSPLRIAVRQAAGETPGLTDYISVKSGEFSSILNTTGYAEGLYLVHLEHPTRASNTVSFNISRPAISLILNGGRNEVITGKSLEVFGVVHGERSGVKLGVKEGMTGPTLRTYDLPVRDGIFQAVIETHDYDPGDYLFTVSIPEGSVSETLTIRADTSTIALSPLSEPLVQGEPLIISGTVDGLGEYASLEIIRVSDSYLSLNRQAEVRDGRFSASFGTTGLLPGEYLAQVSLQNGASDEISFVIEAP